MLPITAKISGKRKEKFYFALKEKCNLTDSHEKTTGNQAKFYGRENSLMDFFFQGNFFLPPFQFLFALARAKKNDN